jgi:hypothetical protein
MLHDEHSRELLTVEEFLEMSAKINYQLSAHTLNKPALMALVLGPARFEPMEWDLLLGTIDVLQAGYGEDRRRLGTPEIIHPLRTAAILARTMSRPSVVEVGAALLHDKEEDLTSEALDKDRYDGMLVAYDRLIKQMSAGQQEQIELLVRGLSARPYDTYHEYLVSLLKQAPEMPELLHIKLADRLDNTFDIHLQHPGVTRYNFFRAVFDILFMPVFRGVQMGHFHFMPDVKEGVMLLSQLFKDTFFLALLRATGMDTLDDTTRRLFIGLAVAGIREAQWLALEVFNTSITDVNRQRELLMSVMQYCRDGGAGAVRTKEAGGELDGMLLESFIASQEGQQKQMLTRLFDDHELLAKLVLAFIVVFASFINDPTYTIQGIQTDGMQPVGAE